MKYGATTYWNPGSGFDGKTFRIQQNNADPSLNHFDFENTDFCIRIWRIRANMIRMRNWKIIFFLFFFKVQEFDYVDYNFAS